MGEYKRILLRRCNGYYTVEATFVVTICSFVLIAILYTGLYVHDLMLVESYASVYTGIRTRSSDMIENDATENDGVTPKAIGKSSDDISALIREKLESDLFIFDLLSVEIDDGLLTRKISVDYAVPVSLGFLVRAWGSDDPGKFNFEVEKYKTSKIKWDADGIKNNKNNGSIGK